MKEEVEFTEMQKKFLKQFVSKNYTLPREIINSFSKKNNIFPTILINEINEMFYEVHEDNLILEEGEAYIISDIYRSTIQI
jgi:SNF2 family DNA or RNA helicase